jgi:uncharacterized protein (TIGR00290 family)
MGKPRAVISWSSGKDSAWTLHLLRQQDQHEICGLLTTLNAEFDRVAMHGTRRSILEAQAAAAGLPLIQVPLPWPCSNAVYEKCMREAVASMLAQGVSVVAFGDLFLQDVRQYRERQLEGTGLTPVFPLWRIPTRALMEEMIGAGVRASITCLDPKKMPRELAGRELTLDLLDSLPSDVDPCGENGEFHTVVHAGPMFRAPIELTAGGVVERDGFVFADSQSSVTV